MHMFHKKRRILTHLTALVPVRPLSQEQKPQYPLQNRLNLTLQTLHYLYNFSVPWDLVPASCNISSLRDVELTEDDRMGLSALLSGPADHEVLIDKYNIDMTRKKISCLKPRTWLNDEVINFYVAMMMQEGGSIYSFSTFFMIRLYERGNYTFKNVARWTKNLDIFRLKKMFIPINYK